jgi:hypothetical protein
MRLNRISVSGEIPFSELDVDEKVIMRLMSQINENNIHINEGFLMQVNFADGRIEDINQESLGHYYSSIKEKYEKLFYMGVENTELIKYIKNLKCRFHENHIYYELNYEKERIEMTLGYEMIRDIKERR